MVIAVRLIYSLLWYLLLPFIFLATFCHARKIPEYNKRWREKFGIYTGEKLDHCIWVHAVSLGEVIAATPLIKKLQVQFPKDTILITTATATGAKKVAETFGNKINHAYFPYDFPCAIRRFFKQFQPKLLVIMETELWPNLLFYSQKTNLPTIIANARLSIKSTRNYSLLKPFLKKLLQDVIIAAQSDLDKERFITIGANLENVTTVGNIKFDLTIDPEIIAKANQLREKIGKERPVWIAASTHQGEDEQVLQAFKIAKEKIANLLLILVPRHPERFASVENLCKAYGFNAINYTQAKACGYNIEILIGNTVGDLLTFYGAADVAFVGGSLVPIGGHNLLEPVALNLPVISGPNLNNFIDISKLLLQKNALLIAHNPNELANELEKLFNDANLRQQMITSGQQVISANHGAIEKILLLITKNIL